MQCSRFDRSGELLTQIEAANAFLIPLDDGREWYRYHTLFAELLRQQLRRREPARVAALHKRASEWFERNDAPADAVHHALESGDLELSAERIATHWHSLVTEGLNARLAGWLEALPEQVLASDARLCLAMAWTLFSLGRLDEMAAWVELVETAPLPVPFRDGTASREAGAANLRASRLNVVGDTSAARQWAERALQLQPDDWPWRAIATLVLGNAQSWLGRPDAAIRPLEETVRLTQEMAPLAAIQALGQLALLAADRGDWPAAERLAAEAAEVIDRTGTTEYWMTALWRAAWARIEQHRGGARSADALSERAIEVARRSASPPLIALALLQRARILTEQGSRGAASACLFEAEAELRRCPDPRVHRAAVDSIRRMIRGRSERSSSTELTDRELAVLRMLGSPLTQREIGSELYVSLNTVKTHVNSIRRKLCASSRAEAVTRGRELGLI
jgi:LuxR family maltose regulon positive regulatory protein